MDTNTVRILWLYKYDPQYDFDNHLHMKYARNLSTHPDVKLMVYGKGFDGKSVYEDIVQIPYNDKITLDQIYQQFKFDVIIVNTKSRCFDYYSPHEKVQRGEWLPSDFTAWTRTPKLMIEEDYHYETEDNWYNEKKFDLILQRHYSQSLRQDKVPMLWHPFSVDTKLFGIRKLQARTKKIAFIGNAQPGVYKFRADALAQLLKNDFVSSFKGTIIRGQDYINKLQEYISFLSCGSMMEICAAKNFEIMASGAVLFTNKFKGIDELFPRDAYVSYENNGSDVLTKARKILNDDAFTNHVKNVARETINKSHSHLVRNEELIQIIKTHL